MSKDILNMYGPNSSQPQAGRLSGCDQAVPKEMNYQTPTTDVNHYRQSPGLGGNSYGNCGTQK